MSGSEGLPAGTTLGGFDTSGRLWVLGMCGVGGAAVGAVLPYAAGFAADLPWFPFQGPLRLVASFEMPWLVWGRPLVGLIAGLVLALWIMYDSPRLHLTVTEIRVERRGEVQRVIAREKVDAVHHRGSKLVIETAAGRELFSGDVEGDRAALREAFLAYGYPWEGGDG